MVEAELRHGRRRRGVTTIGPSGAKAFISGCPEPGSTVASDPRTSSIILMISSHRCVGVTVHTHLSHDLSRHGAPFGAPASRAVGGQSTGPLAPRRTQGKAVARCWDVPKHRYPAEPRGCSRRGRPGCRPTVRQESERLSRSLRGQSGYIRACRRRDRTIDPDPARRARVGTARFEGQSVAERRPRTRARTCSSIARSPSAPCAAMMSNPWHAPATVCSSVGTPASMSRRA